MWPNESCRVFTGCGISPMSMDARATSSAELQAVPAVTFLLTIRVQFFLSGIRKTEYAPNPMVFPPSVNGVCTYKVMPGAQTRPLRGCSFTVGLYCTVI